jgi:omega-amidase
MSQQRMRIKVLQFHVEAGNPDANFKKAQELLLEAVNSEERPDVILMPEMWNTGYALDRIHELADRDGERTKQMMSKICREYQVMIIAGSVAVKSGDHVHNTIYVFNRQGEVIADYSKIHLFRLMEEEKHLTAGEHVGELTLEGVPAGMIYASLSCHGS